MSEKKRGRERAYGCTDVPLHNETMDSLSALRELVARWPLSVHLSGRIGSFPHHCTALRCATWRATVCMAYTGCMRACDVKASCFIELYATDAAVTSYN